MLSKKSLIILIGLISLQSCSRLSAIGQAPEFSPANDTPGFFPINTTSYPSSIEKQRKSSGSSLWQTSQNSFLQNRKASETGDIVTVVIEIDDEAQWSNSTDRSRAGSEELNIEHLLGLPESIAKRIPLDINEKKIISTESESLSEGDGNISRREKLALRVAATIIGERPNGILQISGTQEVRVNYELRELTVSGFVRPQDINRLNEVDYDRLASARISYGGRGQISDMQQPRYGQQISDVLLPF